MKTFIFDLDGLIFNTEIVAYKKYKDLLLEYGYDFDLEDYTQNYSGKTALGNMEAIIEKFQLPISVEEGLEYTEKKASIYFQDGVDIKSGVKELLEYLKKNSYNIALASSSTRERARFLLQEHSIEQYFSVKVFGVEVIHGKPHPDIFLKVCEIMDQDPKNCLVLEDSEAGIEAAYRANIPVICIPDMKKPTQEFIDKTVAIFPSLLNVIEYLETSYFYDYHVHTEYSDDSQYLMEDVVKDAIDMNMDEICFTDHVDYGIKVDWDSGEKIQYRNNGINPLANVDYPKYISEIEKLQKQYGDKIRIKKGIEFGVQTHTIPKFQNLLDTYDFDFVLLSCHQSQDKEFCTKEFQKGKTQLEYNLGYYQELLNVMKQYKGYSVLSHLDLIVRYDDQGIFPFGKVKSIITEILQLAIHDGKGIEVNTSYKRYGLSDLTPSRDILRLYKELGGTILTIGSDSHRKEHLGTYIKETKEELRQLGFKQYCTFESMKPVFHAL